MDADLSALAVEAVDAMAASRDRPRRRPWPPGPPGRSIVHGDPHRLHQLLANLLSNAVKFTPPGGRVVVRVDALGTLGPLDVLDDGPGIPTDEREQLFERFYRLATAAEQGIPGSGLGLAIAKSVVEAHSGTIEIVDTPGLVDHLPGAPPVGPLRARASSGPLDGPAVAAQLEATAPRPYGRAPATAPLARGERPRRTPVGDQPAGRRRGRGRGKPVPSEQ